MSKKDVLIIGSGLAGLSCAVRCAEKGLSSYLISPFNSERSQSVMAAGGINGAIHPEDSYKDHADETYEAGCRIEVYDDILSMCRRAPEIIDWLKTAGTVFSRNKDGSLSRRAFGGQKFKRTCYSGASTGKQIISALVQKCREYEIKGLVERLTDCYFTEAVIENGRCIGAVFFRENSNEILRLYADRVVMACGGLNGLYDNTTGSKLNDAYAAAKLFMQGAALRNLEFVQLHPTSVKTGSKNVLISEAARGEGGRLFYSDGDKKHYFMEEAYGPNGNLMTRDVVSRCVDSAPAQVYLDLSSVPEDALKTKLGEVLDACRKYLNIDAAKEPIPVETAVHFFMGGLKVDSKHMTSINGLYAIGECASKYHGANRLGGNSLLAAIYGAFVLADEFSHEEGNEKAAEVTSADKDFAERLLSEKEAAVRLLNKACVLSCESRKESRGAFFREDYPESSFEFEASSVVEYVNGEIKIAYEKEAQKC